MHVQLGPQATISMVRMAKNLPTLAAFVAQDNLLLGRDFPASWMALHPRKCKAYCDWADEYWTELKNGVRGLCRVIRLKIQDRQLKDSNSGWTCFKDAYPHDSLFKGAFPFRGEGGRGCMRSGLVSNTDDGVGPHREIYGA